MTEKFHSRERLVFSKVFCSPHEDQLQKQEGGSELETNDQNVPFHRAKLKTKHA